MLLPRSIPPGKKLAVLVMSIQIITFTYFLALLLFYNGTDSKANQKIGLLQNRTRKHNRTVNPFDSRRYHCGSSDSFMTVAMVGRLGNAMSEYATLLSYSLRDNRLPFLNSNDKRNLARNFEHLSVPSFAEVREVRRCRLKWKQFFIELVSSRNEYERNGKNPMVPSRLVGYPDAIHLYNAYIEEIHEEFKFSKDVSGKAGRYLRRTLSAYKKKLDDPDAATIFVHNRRTDYEHHLKVVHKGSPVGSKYFNKAIQHYRSRYKNVLFFLFSDDMDWYRGKICGDDVVWDDGREHYSPIEDMALMTLCDHAIISYGTFGFWSAFLGPHFKGGTVIAASRFSQIPTPLERYLPKIPEYSKNWIFMDDS